MAAECQRFYGGNSVTDWVEMPLRRLTALHEMIGQLKTIERIEGIRDMLAVSNRGIQDKAFREYMRELERAAGISVARSLPNFEESARKAAMLGLV